MTWCSDGAVQTFFIDMSQVTSPQHNCIMGLHGWGAQAFSDSCSRSAAAGRVLTRATDPTRRTHLVQCAVVYLIISYSEWFCVGKRRAPYPGRWNTWRESGRCVRAPLLLCTRPHIGSRRWSLGRGLRFRHRSWGVGRGLRKEEKKILINKMWKILMYLLVLFSKVNWFYSRTLFLYGMRTWIISAWAGKELIFLEPSWSTDKFMLFFSFSFLEKHTGDVIHNLFLCHSKVCQQCYVII